MLPSNTLLLNLILRIDVTFSTPTGDFTHNSFGQISSKPFCQLRFGNYTPNCHLVALP